MKTPKVHDDEILSRKISSDFGQRRREPSRTSSAHLSRVDGALQRRLLLAQVGVGVAQPGQGGAVGVEVRLLVWRVEEPALQRQQEVSEGQTEVRGGYSRDGGSPFCRG